MCEMALLNSNNIHHYIKIKKATSKQRIAKTTTITITVTKPRTTTTDDNQQQRCSTRKAATKTKPQATQATNVPGGRPAGIAPGKPAPGGRPAGKLTTPSKNHPKNKKRKEKEATAKANPQPRTTHAQTQTKPTQNNERTKRCSNSN